MSDPIQMTPEQLQAALAQALAARTAPMVPAPMFQQQPAPMFQQPFQQQQMMPAAMMAAPALAPTGLLVPADVTLPDGREARVYVQLSAEAVQNPVGAVQSLISAGYPVSAWRPKNQQAGHRSGWGR